MSWQGYPPQGGANPPYGYTPPPQGQVPSYPPQNMAYQQPPYGGPPGQYPPQGQGQYPPQAQYPPPQGYPPQGYPPQGYPPQGYPPQGGPGQYGYQQGPPAQQPYSQPTPPTLGYDPRQVANVNTDRDCEALHKAMKGFGTNEMELIRVLAAVPDPLIMAAIRRNFNHRFMRDLLKDVEKETSGYFREGLMAIVRGPLDQDVWNLNDAIKGAGTKEHVLNDVLLGRSNADINAIKAEYQRVYKRNLEGDVRDDLSMKTERLFSMVLAAQRAEESSPVIPQQLEHDVSELHRATEGTKFGADQTTVCMILSSRSDGQLRAISQAFSQKYHIALAKVIEKEFSGHMEDALLRMLHKAQDSAMADAKALEATMKGVGTKDRLLTNRIVRIHWNKDHMQQVKGAYKHFYKRDLATRVKGEVSGDYERLMLALIG